MSNNLGTSLLCLSAFGSAVYIGSQLLAGNNHQNTSVKKNESCLSKPTLRKQLEQKNIVEICLSDIKSVFNAFEGGASSVEICVNRFEGGVTPSVGLIEETVKALRATTVAVNVLIRPRAGDFIYCPSECEVIQRDILSAKIAGADGIVFGALTADGRIDRELLTVVRLLSEGMTLTFHRAFDVCSDDLEAALEDVIAAGCNRLLTSGRAGSVTEGIETLRRLVLLARGRIVVVAGCGVSVENATEVIRRTGVTGVHAGSAVTSLVGLSVQSSSAKSVTNHAQFGSVETLTPIAEVRFGKEMSQWQCVDAAKVRALVNNAAVAWTNRDVGLEERLTVVVPPLVTSALRTGEDTNETLSRSDSESDGRSPNSREDVGYIHVSGSSP